MTTLDKILIGSLALAAYCVTVAATYPAVVHEERTLHVVADDCTPSPQGMPDIQEVIALLPASVTAPDAQVAPPRPPVRQCSAALREAGLCE